MHAAVILHGANGSAAEVWPIATGLRRFAPVFVPDLSGHGGRPVPSLLRFAGIAADVLAQLDARCLQRVFFVGYSLGGTLGLYLARHHPERVIGVASLAAKVAFDRATIDKWTYLIDPARLSRPGNPRQFELERIHFPQAWRDVALANRSMFLNLLEDPPLSGADLASISVPTLSLCGDADQIVTQAESTDLVRRLRGAGGFFAGQAHPLAAVPLAAVTQAIGNWIHAVEHGKVAAPATAGEEGDRAGAGAGGQ